MISLPAVCPSRNYWVKPGCIRDRMCGYTYYNAGARNLSWGHSRWIVCSPTEIQYWNGRKLFSEGQELQNSAEANPGNPLFPFAYPSHRSASFYRACHSAFLRILSERQGRYAAKKKDGYPYI